jgi:hypothetical protein
MIQKRRPKAKKKRKSTQEFLELIAGLLGAKLSAQLPQKPHLASLSPKSHRLDFYEWYQYLVQNCNNEC